jgi:hypothetical protein
MTAFGRRTKLCGLTQKAPSEAGLKENGNRAEAQTVPPYRKKPPPPRKAQHERRNKVQAHQPSSNVDLCPFRSRPSSTQPAWALQSPPPASASASTSARPPARRTRSLPAHRASPELSLLLLLLLDARRHEILATPGPNSSSSSSGKEP